MSRTSTMNHEQYHNHEHWAVPKHWTMNPWAAPQPWTMSSTSVFNHEQYLSLQPWAVLKHELGDVGQMNQLTVQNNWSVASPESTLIYLNLKTKEMFKWQKILQWKSFKFDPCRCCGQFCGSGSKLDPYSRPLWSQIRNTVLGIRIQSRQVIIG